MISPELQNFYERWLRKAREYRSDNLQDCFDKFFTLFVAYNRLYAELTLSLARGGVYGFRGRSVPDAFGAKCIVHQYLGTCSIWACFQNDQVCRNSIESIAHLIEQGVFAIKLDRLYGKPQRTEDLKLLKALISNSEMRKVHAILDIIYSIRCNMFHGHKGFNEIQIQILTPVTALLEELSGLLYEKMSYDIKL